MRRIFNTNFNNQGVHFMLLVLRVAVSAFILTHGYQKLQWVTAGGEIQFGDPVGLGAPASLYLATFAEFFCAILLLLGLASRLATIPLIVTMMVVVFVVNGPNAFEKKELALQYLLVFLFLFVSGPGKYSVDYFIDRSLNPRRR